MVKVSYSIGGGTPIVKQFPKTRTGNSQSIKFISQLYKERKKDLWYFNLKKIKILADKIEKYKGGKKAKTELKQLQNERTQILEKHGLDLLGEPPIIKIEIIQT